VAASFTVYCLTNFKNGKRYVGQTQDLVERFRNHRNNRHCRVLFSAIRKYGSDAFRRDVLAVAPSRSRASEIERAAIRDLNTVAPHGYNLREGGYQGGRWTEESRKRMSEIAKRRGVSKACRDAQRKAATGRQEPPQVTEKRAAKMRGRKRPEHGALMRAYFADPENNERLREGMTLKYSPRRAEGPKRSYEALVGGKEAPSLHHSQLRTERV